MKLALERYKEAAAAAPVPKEIFTLGFIAALAVGYDPHGRTESPERWDRCLQIATNTAWMLEIERQQREAERAKGTAA